MRPYLQRLFGVTALALCASCSGPVSTVGTGPGGSGTGGAQKPKPQSQGLELVAARDLVRAAPADWEARWDRLRKMGNSATPAILRALKENPQGEGAQAAIHLLGEARDERSRAYLVEVMGGGTELGSEAALALGKLADPETVDDLRAVVGKSATPMTTRAAAAAALVSMGEGRSVVSFMEAVFLAASPFRGSTGRKHGIPASKTRWAHERYMIIEALRGRYEGETFGLDEDSSWPAMRDGAAAMGRRLRGK